MIEGGSRLDESSSKAPDWAKVDGGLGYAKCPACELFLPDEPDQRDKRCPKCLRDRGEAVL